MIDVPKDKSVSDTPANCSSDKAVANNKDGVLVGDKAKLTAEVIVAAALSSSGLVEPGSEVSIKDMRLL